MYNNEIEYVDETSKDAIEFIFANIEEYETYKKVNPDELEDFLKNNIVVYPKEKCDCQFCYQLARDNFLATSVI